VPEIAALSDKWLFNPWEAPDGILKAAETELGQTNPTPIVDLNFSRHRAHDAFSTMTNAN